MDELRMLLVQGSTLVALSAVVALGLSAGAMLTEAVVLVSYWRSLPAPDFLKWFGENEPRLVAFYSPLQVASTALSIAAACLFRFQLRTGGGLLIISAFLAIAVLVTYFLYFKKANASFVARTIHLDKVADELGRWALWQWIRTAIGVGSFTAALIAV
jgi:hypothetical protein